MEKNGFRQNIIYSSIYQVISIITPLVTAPYLSRTIGAEGNGAYNYTLAFANFFFLFAMLGVNNYGTRKIAQIRHDKKSVSKAFWGIYSLQLILSLFFSSVYVLICFLFVKSQIVLFLLQGLVVFAAATDINWFAFGIEEFKYVTIRNIIIKICTFAAIFIFVRDSMDTWKYILIVELGVIFGLLALWPMVKRETHFCMPKFKEIMSHLKPNLLLFVPVVATSIFQYTDKIMLGAFIDNNAVGHYSYAESILNVPLSLIMAVCTVAMPRITNMLSKKDDGQAVNLFERCVYVTAILEIAMFFGVAAVSNRFIPLYLGGEFVETAKLLVILSVVIPLSGTASVIRTMLLIPNSKDKLYVTAIVSGAAVNVVGNLFLLPIYGAVGACISTIASYAFVLIVQIAGSRKEFSYLKLSFKLIPYIAIGMVMYIFIRCIDTMLTINPWLLLLIEIAGGVIIYGLGAVVIFVTISHISKKYNKKTE